MADSERGMTMDTNAAAAPDNTPQGPAAGLGAPAGQPAAEPNQSASATSPTGDEEGESSTEPGAQKPDRQFSQAEVDDLIKREKAKAEAKAERRVMRGIEKITQRPQQAAPQQSNPQVPVDDGKPTRAQFASDEQFVDALTDWKLEQRDRAVQQQRQHQAAQETVSKTERLYADAEKEPGFDRDEFDALPLTPAIVQALLDSDVATRLMAHMAANPEEVARIAKLSPVRQAAEIGKLEAKLPAQTAQRSKAPPPIEPVGRRGNAAPVDLARAPMEQYIAERKKQGATWAR
jgi:hypothetical protein